MAVSMTMPFVISMAFVISMIFFMVSMAFFMVIVVAMIFFMIIVIFFMVIIVIITPFFMVFLMIIVVVINVNLAVEVFSLSPNQSGANGSFNRERTSIAKAPLKDTTKHAIDGVVLGIPLKVGVKSTMAFDGDDGREVEFTGFKSFTRSTMGAVGFGRRYGSQWAQQKSRKGKA